MSEACTAAVIQFLSRPIGKDFRAFMTVWATAQVGWAVVVLSRASLLASPYYTHIQTGHAALCLAAGVVMLAGLWLRRYGAFFAAALVGFGAWFWVALAFALVEVNTALPMYSAAAVTTCYAALRTLTAWGRPA